MSLFSQKRKQILHVEKFENKKSDEEKVVEALLSKLDLQGVIFTFDALRCKKLYKKTPKARTIMLSKLKLINPNCSKR